jgi:hypothetical protein
MARELTDIEVYVVRDNENDQAILVQLDGGAPKVWLPRSEIEIEYRRGKQNVATVTLPEWLAQDKGLI